MAFRLRTLLVAAAIASAGVGLTACGGSSSTKAAPPPSTAGTPVNAITLTMQGFAFHPMSFTVTPGARITVVNDDIRAEVKHNFSSLPSAPAKFSTGDISPGGRVTITAPTKPGRYPFYCTIHDFMTGTMIVKAG